MSLSHIHLDKEDGVIKKISVMIKDRKTDLICGNRYKVEPLNIKKMKNGGLTKPRHVGRIGILVGFIIDNFGVVSKARIKFEDSGRVGKLDLEDLVEI